MALRFMDSFEHYATADLLQKYTTLTSTPSIGATGRNGNGLTMADVDRLTLALDAQPTWIVGFAYKLDAASGDRAHLSFFDTATAQVELRIASQKMQLTRNGTVLGTSTTTFVEDIWYYVEVKFTISDTVGVAALRVNGVSELNLTNQDTRNAGTTANTLTWGTGVGGGAPTWIIDDVYVCDGTGAAPANDFLGDCRVENLMPNGNGNSSQFDGSDGNTTDNYLLVDEAVPNDDTDYVESPDVNDKDTYTYGNLVTTAGTIYGVQPLPHLRKTDAGSRTFVSVARLAGTEVDSSARSVLDSYIYRPDVREAKPGGGVWTVSDVNSAEFGIKVAS